MHTFKPRRPEFLVNNTRSTLSGSKSNPLRAKRIRLDLLVPSEQRTFKEDRIALYRTKNLRRFPPIAVKETGDGRYLIVNGHHRFYARKDLGFTHIMAYVFPAPRHYNTSGLYVVWRNRVFDYGPNMWSRNTHRRVSHGTPVTKGQA